jgi:hypothetical protein
VFFGFSDISTLLGGNRLILDIVGNVAAGLVFIAAYAFVVFNETRLSGYPRVDDIHYVQICHYSFTATIRFSLKIPTKEMHIIAP